MRNVFSTAKFQQEFEQNGYAVIDLLNESEVQYLLNFDQTNPPPDDLVAPGMSFSINTSELLYRRLITEEIKKFFTPKLITHFLNYKIVLCNFIRKKANKLLSAMPLHQDPSLVDEFSQQSFAVWCPLVDVDQQNGCLQVVKKSHLLSSRIRPFSTFDGFPYSPDILSLMREKYLTSIPMKAGQALIYDKRLFHCSPPNLTTVERVTAVCSLVPEDILTRFYYREAPTSSKVELFEVDDEFYDRYIIGQKPEGVKSLGIFDYEVEPLTPKILMETLEEDSKLPSTNNQVLSPQSQGWMLTAQQLQDELTQTQAELKESNEQLHLTQEQLDELKIQQSQTQAELEQSQTQLRAELTESMDQLHQKTRELESLKEEHSQARSQLERDREQWQRTQAELEAYYQQLNQARSQVEQLESQQQQDQAELEQSRQQLQQTQAQLQQSECQLHQTQTELEQSQIQLHQKTVELEKVKSQQHQTRLAEIIRGRYP